MTESKASLIERASANDGASYHNILAIEEGSYVARSICSHEPLEVAAFTRLRHSYFVCRKGWVKEDPEHPGHEADRYDPHAWHLAVFEGEQMLAYLRVLPWQAGVGYMLEHEFNRLLTNMQQANLIHTGAVELSRLVLAPCVCGRRNAQQVIEVLLKLLYHLSLDQQIQHYYIVVEEPWLRAFPRRFHLPFQAIGQPCVFPDGTATVAGYTTRTALEQAVASHDPYKFQWYQRLSDL